jgi:glycerol-3-phosphate acyltransferase PlsY
MTILMSPTTMICCLGAFLSGSIPFGLLLMKVAGKGDVRTQGSGNIGATNVMRIGGKGLGITTLLLDAGKGFLPVWAARQAGLGPESLAFVALVAVLGHVFTPWLKFKGGKGVATALGTVLAYHPAMVLPALGVFILELLIFRYVSLGSILAALALFLTALGLMGSWAILPLRGDLPPWSPLLAWGLLAGLVIIKHRANVDRLLHGTESRFWGATALPK